MTRINFLILVGFILIVINGCASQIMIQTSPVKQIEKDKAQVTFLMLSSVLTNTGDYGSSITPIEYDIWDGEKFVGAISKDTYIQYIVDEGEHLFIARGGNWSFVKANLLANKKYYLYLNVYPRFWGPWGVYLQPVKSNDNELISELPSQLDNIVPMSIIEDKYDSYAAERIEELKAEIKAFEANPEYGYSVLDPEDGQ